MSFEESSTVASYEDNEPCTSGLQQQESEREDLSIESSPASSPKNVDTKESNVDSQSYDIRLIEQLKIKLS